MAEKNMADGTKEYLSFELEIRPLTREDLEVRVLRSPGHRHAKGPFSLPPGGREDLERLISNLEASVRGDARAGLKTAGLETVGLETAAAPRLSVKDLGSQLYEAVFPKGIDRALTASLGKIEPLNHQDPDQGLRIRMIFDKELADVASLPWEILHHQWERGYLGRSAVTPLSRTIPGASPVPTLEISPPLRVLIVASAPRHPDLGSLDLKEEHRRIRKALQDLPSIEIEVVEPPTFHRLIDILDGDDGFHILHFMGHGAFDTKSGRGGLWFEKPDGTADLVPGHVLVDRLEDYRFLRLVVLNTCRSAQMPRNRGQNPFTGVATAFGARGMPAVVAMQFPISDRAAIVFGEKFYSVLAKGEPVDVATAKGRDAIYGENPYSLEWITPTLFMQVPDGDLRIRGKVPIKLGIRSLEGWDAGMEERARPLSLLDQFDGRDIRQPSRWQGDVYPRLADFLAREAVQDEAIHLELPAHSSIAFAAGYVLEAKSGYDISLRQRGARGTHWWKADEGSAAEGASWGNLTPTVLGWEGRDLVVGVSITKDVAADLQVYIKREGIPVSHVILASLVGGPGQKAIRDGAHAFDLAEELMRCLEGWQKCHQGLIHLFAAAPNGFMFFLGQLSRDLRKGIQLYEFDFDPENQELGAYSPALIFPPKQGSD